ncbi:MAG TPA: hypothetical protein VE621_03760 [Bryobacteraceae bacterium]|jgi:hypothetical protein|nr:hypothetical protein [Bryobacteraceae bacterium]
MRQLATLAILLAGSVSAFGQYTVGKASAPPAAVSPGILEVLSKDGIQIKNGDKVYAEIWFRKTIPAAPKTTEDNVTLPTIPHGALIGVINFPANASDRRGHRVPAGVYTLRYSMFPQNGDHQGVSPQRDFLLITKASDDTDPNATPSWKALTEASSKSMGIPHPGVFSIWRGEAGKDGLVQEGEHDWVLHATVGNTPIAMIVIGKAEG